MMRIALICAGGYAERLLASELRQRGSLALMVVEDKPRLAQMTHILKRRESVLKRVDRAVHSVLYHLIFGRLMKGDRQRFMKPTPPLSADAVTPNINAPEILACVRQCQPDLILVCRTSILRKGWFELGIPMLNVHPGIAPQYRGLSSLRWAVIRDDVANIGVTVHRVTPQVDTGEIVVQERLADVGDLSLAPTVAKLEELMAACALRAVSMLEHGQPPDPSLPRNHGEYKAYLEIGLSDFVRFWWARRRFRQRNR